MTYIFQCTGCPTGPCTLINMDPEFTPGSDCMDIRYKNINIAVWREMVVRE
jgi:hypothetical protein